MPPKKHVPNKTPEELVVPAEQLQEVKLSHTKARKLLQNPDDGRKKERTEAQKLAWQKCLEARNAFQASKRAEREIAVEEATELLLQEGKGVKVKVMPKRERKPKPPPEPVPQTEETYSEVSSAEEEPPKPAPKKVPVRSKIVYATDTAEETELTDEEEIPKDVPVKKRVLVPKKVKEAVHKVREINKVIQQVQQPHYGASQALANIWRPRM